MRRKIDDLTNKWYSTKCMLKEYLDDNLNTDIGLTCLDKLEKNELVAIFSCENSSNIKPELHYIRHSETPNCYLDKKRVFTKECVQELTELTIKYA